MSAFLFTYRADADAGGGLALAVWGRAAGSGCTRGGQSWQGDELDALRQGLLLLLEVTEQLSLGLGRQLVEQGVLGELLLQRQGLCCQGLRKDEHRLFLGYLPVKKKGGCLLVSLALVEQSRALPV